MARTSSASQISLIPLSLPETINEKDPVVNTAFEKKPIFYSVRKTFLKKKQEISIKKRRRVGIIGTNANSSSEEHSNGNGSLFQTQLGSNGHVFQGQTNQVLGIKDENGHDTHTMEPHADFTESVTREEPNGPRLLAWWKPQTKATRTEKSEQLKEQKKQDGKSTSKLKRRNSAEKFAHLSLLTPAFILHPAMHGSDTITQKFANSSDDNFQLKLAAAHINDAIKGRGKFGEARAFFKSKLVQKCFRITDNKIWASVMYLTIAFHCLMMLWEQPGKPVSIGQQWSPWNVHPVVLIIDALCLLIYIVDLMLHTVFLSLRNVFYAKEKVWIRLEFVLTIFFIIDFIVLVAEAATQTRLLCPFRCFRATMLLCKAKNVSHVFSVLLSIISKLGKVFLIIAIFITTFASVGLHVFMDDYKCLPQPSTNDTTSSNCTNIYTGAFDHVASAALHMFVLMSTENYPEFIIPAFQKSWVNFIYFGLYLYVGVFFLTAILLAIIVESYWDYSKRHIKQERRQQREELAKAWNLMDPLGSGLLSVDDPKLLELFAILKPKNTVEENQELIKYMSMCDDGVIDSYDWTTKLIDALSFVFENEETDCESSSPLCCSSWSKVQTMCKTFIHAQVVNIIILLLIVMHSILFALIWSGIPDVVLLAIQSTKTAIVALFVLEVILRLVADGRDLLNLFDVLDMLMIVFAAAAYIAWYIIFFTPPKPEPVYLGACSVVSGVSILTRAVFNSQHARTGVNVLRNIYPVMFDLILLVITIIFFYAVLGLEILQDQNLSNSIARGYHGSYVEYDCGVGFETFGCSLLVVFQIVTTNDWHEIMLGAMLDAGWACVFYFVSCYLIVNMIVMNLFVAISIEAYKKLARDDSATASNKIDYEDPQEKAKTEDTSIKSAAKNKLSDIFASSRKSRASVGSGTLTGFTSSPFAVRRGTLGSTGHHTPTPTPRNDDTYIDDATVLSLASRANSPRRKSRPETSEISTESPSTRGFDRRQLELKRRENKRRKERKLTKQEEKVVDVTKKEEKKLQIDGVVRLKKAVKAIKGFHARSAREMSISEGDVITVSEEAKNMYRGPGGWFPSNHVVSVQKDSGDDDHVNARASPDEKPRVKFDVGTKEAASPKKARVMSPRQRISVSRLKKKNDGGDWRRSILGDITVMNKDEFKALQGKFRGGLERRHTSQLRSVVNQLSLPITEELSEDEEEESNEGEDNVVPKLTVSEVPVESESKQEADAAPSTDTITLTVPDRGTSQRKVAPDKKKAADGEMPDWVAKFVTEKQVMVDEDVKLRERSTSDEEGNISSIPNVVIHREQIDEEAGKSPASRSRDSLKAPLKRKRGR